MKRRVHQVGDRRFWTMREVAEVRAHMHLTDAKIAEKLGRSRKSVETQRLKLVGRKMAARGKSEYARTFSSTVFYLLTGECRDTQVR